MRCTFHNNMRISKRQLFLNQQTARVRQCISLDRFVVRLRLAHRNLNKEGRTLHGLVAQIQDSSVLTFVPKSCSSHDHEKSTFRLKRIMCCADLKNTHTTIRIISMHQSRKNFFKTRIFVAQLLINQSAFVSDSRMNAQCNYPGSQRLAPQLTRHSHSGRCTLPPLLKQFVIVLIMKAPNADRTVACSTSHDSTQTEPPTIRLHWELNQVFAIIDDATLFLEKIHT